MSDKSINKVVIVGTGVIACVGALVLYYWTSSNSKDNSNVKSNLENPQTVQSNLENSQIVQSEKKVPEREENINEEEKLSKEEELEQDLADKKLKRKKKKKRKKVNEADLLQIVNQSLETVQGSGIVNGKTEIKLAKLLRKLKPSDYSGFARHAFANWMVVYNAASLMSCEDDDMVAALLSTQKYDMEIAWKWLNFSMDVIESPEMLEQVLMTKMDVAQRLKVPEIILSVYNALSDIVASGKASEDCNYLVFTSSALLGHWEDFYQLGRSVMKDHLNEFHEASVERPGIPDYSVLVNIAAVQRKTTPRVNPKILKWTSYVMESCQIKFTDVITANEEQRKELLKQFDSSEWQDVPTVGTRFTRNGAFVHATGISSIPLAMIGPASDSEMLLSGNLDINQQSLGAANMRQTEELKIRRSRRSPSKWGGMYSIMQKQKGHANIHLLFKLKMQLIEDPEIA